MRTMSIMLVSLVLMSCSSKFLEDSFVGPVYFGSSSLLLKINPGLLDAVDSIMLESNMFCNEDSSDTEQREVWFTDSISITTLVNENESYKLRLTDGKGKVFYTGFTIGGISLSHLTSGEMIGPYFWFGIDLSGMPIQSVDNLPDTVVVPIEVYAPSGHTYAFNGTATNYENLALPWNSLLGCYRYDLTVLPGTHRYDWWGSSIDSVKIGNVVIYDVLGSYILFEIVDSTDVTLLDSLSRMYQVICQDSVFADSVVCMVSDRMGDRDQLMIHHLSNWTTSIILPSDTLIYLRVEVDGIAKFTNIEILNTELHHLVERELGQNWFVFQIINNEIIQEENNLTITIGLPRR